MDCEGREVSRSLLHVSKLEEFKAWLDAQGILHRPGRGDYEELQINNKSTAWYCIFSRNHMPEHFTNDKRIDGLILRFIRESKEKNSGEVKASSSCLNIAGNSILKEK